MIPCICAREWPRQEVARSEPCPCMKEPRPVPRERERAARMRCLDSTAAFTLPPRLQSGRQACSNQRHRLAADLGSGRDSFITACPSSIALSCWRSADDTVRGGSRHAPVQVGHILRLSRCPQHHRPLRPIPLAKCLPACLRACLNACMKPTHVRSFTAGGRGGMSHILRPAESSV